MSLRHRLLCWAALTMAGAAAVACGFDDALREYLHVQFWQPFAKSTAELVRPANVKPVRPYAGFALAGQPALERLALAYAAISSPSSEDATPDQRQQRQQDLKTAADALAAARRTPLTAAEKEEVDLVDAKIDLRHGSAQEPARLLQARQKLQAFVQSAQSPALRSEARGWLAYTYYVLGERTAAGKLYLDELPRQDSNLSQETLLNSLQLTYGYDGGRELRVNLPAYFDTPEHAAFAIALVTNPRWNPDARWLPAAGQPPAAPPQPPYEQIKALLLKHRALFRAPGGADQLAVLGMRTALRAADPQAALQIAASVPAPAAVRRDPDFLWMLGGARFLTKDYTGAAAPLQALFQSRRASKLQRAAGAYGLCGVYYKTGNQLEQLRLALWLKANEPNGPWGNGTSNGVGDLSLYLATSGWDLGLLLEIEAPIPVLQEFLQRYPREPQADLVRYSLAVRLAREDRYAAAAELYTQIGARERAQRMRQLAALHERIQQSTGQEQWQAKVEFAALLEKYSTGVYFNKRLWSGLQRYALTADRETALTRRERERLLAQERQLKDQQEEYWRAYQLLREVIPPAAGTPLGSEAAALAIRCLRRISTQRFGREREIATADIALSRSFAQQR